MDSSSHIQTTCQFCSKRPPRYCCPRCHVSYCSVECYKSPVHAQCSETFYKDCVIQEMALQSKKVNSTLDDIPGLSDDIKRMYAILKRMESNESQHSDISDFDISDIEELDSDDDEIDPDLADRLTNIDLNDPNAVWDKLTNAERQDFENIIQSGDVSKLVEVIQPWWTNKIKKVLIEEIPATTSKQSSTELALPPDMPAIIPKIPDFGTISTKSPAPCVSNNLTNVLAAYTITNRFFNGDHLTSPHEAANYLLSVCANLKTAANFDDDQLAIDSVVHDCHNEGLTIDVSQVNVIRSDIQDIYGGPSVGSNAFLLAALSDIHAILRLAKTEKTNSTKSAGEFSQRYLDHQIVSFDTIPKAKLNACLKKVEYYLAYVKKFR